MPIQSRKNNNKYNKYNNNKYNKNKRTRKRPLQKGGYIPMPTEDISGVKHSIQTTINEYNKFIQQNLTDTEYKKINLGFIQVDNQLFFMEQEEEQQGLYNIINKNTTPVGLLRKQVLKDDIKGQFETSISTFLQKTVKYIGQEQVWNPKNVDNSGQPSYYTLFIFETIKADTKVDNEAKIAPSGDTKVEADETGGAKAYATIMNIVKEALKNIDTFYQIIQNDPDMFLLDKQPWKAIDLTERNLALKYFSEQKKKLLGESNKILESMPKTDKGIKTYLNSKEYKDSEFKKLSVEFITQNPYY